jgi:hypothetical protein
MLMQQSDVSLGQPKTAQMNAQAFAVLASMAVQQAAPMQQGAVEVLAKEGRVVLGLYAKHAKGERLLRMVGKQNASLLTARQWSGAELLPVKDVAVEIGNPNEQTAPGRIMKLQTLAQIGVPLTLEQAQQVLDVGRVELAEKATRNELILIAEENELLQAGEAVEVEPTEDHPLHFREHGGDLRGVDIKHEPKRANVVREHMAEHYLQIFGDATAGASGSAMEAMMADQLVAQRMRYMLGRAPVPPELFMMGQTAPPAPGAESGTPAPMPGETTPTQPPAPGTPPDVASQAAQVEMPTNPVDGQQFNPAASPAPGVQA